MHAQAARRNDPLGGPTVLEHEAVQRVRFLTVLRRACGRSPP